MVYRRADNDCRYEIGEFKDGKLNGYGKIVEIRPANGSKGECKETTFGYFVDGNPDGIYARWLDDQIKEAGFFRDGTFIGAYEFTQSHISKPAEDFDYDYSLFLHAKLFHEGAAPEDVQGLCLLYADETYDSQTHRGGPTHKGWEYYYGIYHHDHPEVMIHFVDARRNLHRSAKLAIDSDDQELQNRFSLDWDYRILETEEIWVEQGTESVEKTLYSGQRNLILHLPHSLKKLGGEIIDGPYRLHISVEVYYDGTIAEWDAIPKGETVHKVEEDWYGYYYHNAERYSEYTQTIKWATCVDSIVVHCKDGDTTD